MRNCAGFANLYSDGKAGPVFGKPWVFLFKQRFERTATLQIQPVMQRHLPWPEKCALPKYSLSPI